MNMMYPYNGTRLMPDYPTGFTPDATTAAVVPGLTQLSQWTQWQQGLTPYPPNFSFPAQYPAFPGTPANPYGSGAELGLAGLPYAAGYGAAYPGAVNNAVPFNRGAVPQQQQQQRPAPPSVRT